MTTTVNEYISQVISRMPRATPMRSQIALELQGHIAERLERGQSLDEVVRQLGDPGTLAESYLSAVPLVPASFWRRAAAKAIDTLIVVTVLAAPAGWVAPAIAGFPPGQVWAMFGVGMILALFLMPLYTGAAEYWTGTTLGKYLMGLLVVRESGARIGAGQALLRQLPWFFQFFWIDVFFAVFTAKNQRAFELVSKTRVVRSPHESATRFPTMLAAMLCLGLLGGVPIGAAAGVVAGASTDGSPLTPGSVPPLPAPGQLVDLGGWRIHINCVGPVNSPQPTVILEAGAGGFSVDWSLVLPDVARFARVCAYDRAGLGWSDLGPRPRTLHQDVWELHTLLERANVRPPYVLVGHSLGGILARLFTLTYPTDVAGLVLVDSGAERGVVVFRNGQMVRLVDTATGRPVPDIKTSNPVRDSDLSGNIRLQLEAAAGQMAAHALEAPYDKLPTDAQRMRTWAFAQIKHWAVNDNAFEGEELASLLAEQARTPHPLGDLPLIVLSRGPAETGNSDARAGEEEHARNQATLIALSSAGRQVIATRSGHEIMISEPELVVIAVRDLMATVAAKVR